MTSLEVVVFSFNRGPLLRNCIASLRTFIPDAPVTVFDDGSTDRETSVILDDLSRKGWAKVLTPDAGLANGPAATYGGLYNNMQTFLDFHARSAWVLFLQDDTQVVRTFVPRDRQRLEEIFSGHPHAAFVYPAFLTYRDLYGHVDPASLKADDPSYSFLQDYEFSGYFDVCLAHVARLRAAKWRFENELATSLAARERFGAMRLMRYPFVGHLPSPPTYRNSRQTWTQRIWERYKASLHPIDPLSDSDTERLFSLRDTFPTAEGFLTSTSFWGSHPWPYAKLEGAPASLKELDRIEDRLRHRLSLGAAWLSGAFRRNAGA